MVDHMDKTQIIPYQRCQRMKNQSPALIRHYSEICESKIHVWKKGKDVFNAKPVKYAQPVYYPGVFIMNKNRKALITYDHDQNQENIYNDNGYCDNMKIIPRQDICGLTTIKTPSICKIIQIKDTAAFTAMLNNELSQQISNSQSQKPKYIYNVTKHLKSTTLQPLPLPSPNNSPDFDDTDDDDDDDHDKDSDGDQFMTTIDQLTKTNNENKINDEEEFETPPPVPSVYINNNNNKISDNDDDDDDGDDLAADQCNDFLNKSFIKPSVTSKDVAGAQRIKENTKNKALISTKEDHRTQINFSTKVNFCLMVESGMTHREAWLWCKKHGFVVGKGYSGCGRWARNGSAYYLRLIAENGDSYKFCSCNTNFFCSYNT